MLYRYRIQSADFNLYLYRYFSVSTDSRQYRYSIYDLSTASHSFHSENVFLHEWMPNVSTNVSFVLPFSNIYCMINLFLCEHIVYDN